MDGPARAASVAGEPIRSGAPADPPRVVVIGVGNSMRRDDGAGIPADELALIRRKWRTIPEESPRAPHPLESTPLTGDWVESLTAILEHHDGRFELITYKQFTAQFAPAPVVADEADEPLSLPALA